MCIDSMNHFPDRLRVPGVAARSQPGGRAVFTDPVVITRPGDQRRAGAPQLDRPVRVHAPGAERALDRGRGFQPVRKEMSRRTRPGLGPLARARQRHREALLQIEGEERFEGLQNFFDAVHRLTPSGGCPGSCIWWRKLATGCSRLYPLRPGAENRSDGSGENKQEQAESALRLLGAAFLAACSSEHRSPTVGTLIFDETVTLERGERRDVARREITVDRKATFVAIAEEDDLGLVLRMSHVGVPGTPAAKVEVDSRLSGEGIEIATLDAPPGTRLTVELESAHDFDRPGKARLRILRFDGELAASSRAAAATRRISRVVGRHQHQRRQRRLARTGDPEHRPCADPFRDRPTAIPCWPHGGEWPAAASTIASDVNLTTTISDARIAARGFEALGATRNASRARILEASTLLDIANVSTARNPSAEEAAHLAKELLTALSVDPALSAYERATSVQFLGIHGYNVYNYADARTYFQARNPRSRRLEAVASRSVGGAKPRGDRIRRGRLPGGSTAVRLACLRSWIRSLRSSFEWRF